jgi:hypothetical protein
MPAPDVPVDKLVGNPQRRAQPLWRGDGNTPTVGLPTTRTSAPEALPAQQRRHGVDHDFCAGNERAVVGREKKDQPGDLVRRGGTTVVRGGTTQAAAPHT